jgi:maltose-binding protein MalE
VEEPREFLLALVKTWYDMYTWSRETMKMGWGVSVVLFLWRVCNYWTWLAADEGYLLLEYLVLKLLELLKLA